MKEDIIFLLIYLVTEFFNYTLAYIVIFQAPICRSKMRWLLSVCLILFFHYFMLYYAGREASSAISLISMIVIPVFLLDPREIKYFLIYPFVAIGISVVGISISFLLAAMLSMPEYIIAEGNWLTIICQCVPGSVLLLLSGYRRLKKRASFQVNLDWKQYMLFYIVVLCLFLMLAPMQELTREYGSTKNINAIGFSVSIACIVLVIITIWQGIVVNREIQLKEQNRQNEKYMELQKEYFSHLIEQDEKIRRFRHDMKEHMIVLQACCQNGDYKELEDYLNCIMEESALFSTDNYTGNKSVDAVIRQLMIRAEKQQIKIEMEGKLPEETRAADYDLCTIIANLVKNAIEACEKIDEISNRKIRIAVGAYHFQIFISVKNTFAGDIVKKENRLITTKKDSRNHGLGSGNVENTVKKYDGVLEYRCEEGWFTAEVTI